ncbi:MAG: hypothetical protein L6Q98_21240 [Anaerolineae bacterium]|nr:hypothetical protein [Anaerolineae bacterium]NUQ06113.1 hypothetical protein [Anaerolineae bacterium]
MSDGPGYHSLHDLKHMPTDELQALWDAVPPERRRIYRAAYQKALEERGAVGSDLKERVIARLLIQRYARKALVPLGTRWAHTPTRMQEAAVANRPLDHSDASPRRTTSPLILAVFALALVGMVALLFSRGGGQAVETGRPTATASAQPTLTPLALDAADEVVAGGDAARAASYPISLQAAFADDGAPPRVWVVQRRTVRAAEWRYADDPDVASYLSGLTVQPVIGIPWSDDNAAWFARAGEEASFTLTLNTGRTLRYRFQTKTEVLRSETGLFRQVDPGLALLLIGETDAQGLPTATRTLIRAAYTPEQELERTSPQTDQPSSQTLLPEREGLPDAPTATLEPFAGLEAQLIAARYDTGWLETRLWLYNGGASALTLAADDVWLALGYAENPPGPRTPAEGLAPLTLLPGQAADVTLTWAWGGEPYGTIGIGAWRWGIEPDG